MKKCCLCKQLKSFKEFYSNISRSDGLTSRCVQCVAQYYKQNKQRISRNQKKSDTKRAAQIRDCVLRKKFGITQSDYLRLAAAQDHKCLICDRPEKAVRKGKIKLLAVDHDHKTGKIRGLLCHNCNVGLGNFQDCIIILDKAKEYLLASR